MAKNAYLIISDLHDHCRNLENRYDYPGEVNDVKSRIIDLGVQYKEKGYDVYAILLGDVFHRSYQNVVSGILVNNYWYLANDLFKKIYSVLGNHETTYYSSNPFFTLINSIESTKIQMLHNKVWQPLGLTNIFNVVDEIVDGNVRFLFNHHGCPITMPDSSYYNIGLFHTDFVLTEISKASEDIYHMNPYVVNHVSAKNNELLELYDVCFFAHHHKIYGKWEITTDKKHRCVVQHLASLGRPNVTEVNDNFLRRDIPVVLISDGELQQIDSNEFNLKSRDECVKEAIVELQQKNYERTVSLKLAKDYVPLDDNPMENIRTFLVGDDYMGQVFNDLCTQDRDNLSAELINSLIREGIEI